MSEDAAAIWRAIVGSMRPTWVGPEAFDLLKRYCFAQTESAKLEGQLIATPMTDPTRPALVKQYRDMCQLALSYSRSLRLAPKGNSPRDGRDNGRSYEASHDPAAIRRMPRAWEL
jgi:hypothetical protein